MAGGSDGQMSPMLVSFCWMEFTLQWGDHGIASVGHMPQAESGLLGGLRASIVNWAHTAGRLQAFVVNLALGTHSRRVEDNPAAVE